MPESDASKRSLCTIFVLRPNPNAPKQDRLMQSEQIQHLADKIESLLPPGLKQVKQDFDDKLKKLLQQQLSNMDFVSREEFDIQAKVLARTRQKLEQMEKRLAELESK
jgi:BMFP domain-containing protein YqiC